jgi:hypothetical protein
MLPCYQVINKVFTSQSKAKNVTMDTMDTSTPVTVGMELTLPIRDIPVVAILSFGRSRS